MRRQFFAHVVVGIVSLLVVGCKSRATQVASLTPTHSSTPTVTPTALTAVPAPTTVLEQTPVEATEEIETEDRIEVENETVIFTVVYDNNAYDSALQTAWGFACLVETAEATVLFDTGGDGPTLLGNMTKLGVDPQSIDAVVLSHIHGDHVDGLAGLLDTGASPTVYVPAAFPDSFKDGLRVRTDLVEVTKPVEVLPGIYTTGEVGSGIIEQALVVETEEGLVVVTGCAHPGIVEMVHRAKESVEDEVALVMGGFHLGRANRSQIERIIAEFRRLGVQQTAPCHCTGDRARQMLADAFGTDGILAGVGQVIVVGAGQESLGE